MLPSVIVGQRSAPSFEPLPPFFGDLAAYWTADHGALDANGDPATEGTPVAAWHSRRGASLPLFQSAPAERPAIESAAGMAWLEFGGAQNLSRSNALAGIDWSEATLLIAARKGAIISSAEDAVMLGAGKFEFRSNGDDWIVRYRGPDTVDYTAGGPVQVGEPVILAGRWAADTLHLWHSSLSPSVHAWEWSENNVSGSLHVGSWGAGNRYSGGVGALLLYPRALSDTEITAAIQWLAARYGITLNG